jgi:hypothetical protein
MSIPDGKALPPVNRMFVAVCDRTGRERGVDWVGGPVIIGLAAARRLPPFRP